MQNKNLFFAGDDTWISSFPNYFNESHPFDSFNTFDLESVDNGVNSWLFPAIRSNKFNFLIGHCLGVDHAGHTYEANHPEMKRK